jgi:hypothetical protein
VGLLFAFNAGGMADRLPRLNASSLEPVSFVAGLGGRFFGLLLVAVGLLIIVSRPG